MSHSFRRDGKGYRISPALRQALTLADAEHRASLDVLRDAICEYVEDLREQGVPAHEITGVIQGRIVELRSSSESNHAGPRMDGIVDEMVMSCLDSAH
jgi:hypothetical protein